MARQKINSNQNGGFWEELGRTTLSSSAASMSVASLPQRKYLKLVIMAIPTGGSYDPKFRFNNDSGANYSMSIFYHSGGNALFSNQTNTTFIQASSTIYEGGIGVIEATILNVASFNKQVAVTMCQDGTVFTASQSPILEYLNGKWVSGAIVNRVDIVKGGGTGNLAAGSELIVLGHN